MQVQRIQNNNYNTNFGNKAITGEIKAINKVLDLIQKNMESCGFNIRSEMQAVLHNISIKENIPDSIKQQAKNLLLKSYM